MMYLGAFAFQLGFLVGPTINEIADVEPSLLIQALLYTAIAFTSFSIVALFSKRRSYLFLGGVILTMIQLMFFYRIFGWIMGTSTYNLPFLMCGLFLCCIYIIYDTQVIIEKAERGDKDVPTHTMMLFIDLFDLFIKILQILMELNKNEKKKKN